MIGHTLRELLPVGQFLHSFTNTVHTWPEDRDPGNINCVKFAACPNVPLKVWILAYQWAIENRTVLQRIDTHGTHYFFVSSILKKPLMPKFLATFERQVNSGRFSAISVNSISASILESHTPQWSYLHMPPFRKGSYVQAWSRHEN